MHRSMLNNNHNKQPLLNPSHICMFFLFILYRLDYEYMCVSDEQRSKKKTRLIFWYTCGVLILLLLFFRLFVFFFLYIHSSYSREKFSFFLIISCWISPSLSLSRNVPFFSVKGELSMKDCLSLYLLLLFFNRHCV